MILYLLLKKSARHTNQSFKNQKYNVQAQYNSSTSTQQNGPKYNNHNDLNKQDTLE